MRFLVYRVATGAPIRMAEASVLQDVLYPLDAGLSAIACPYDLDQIYVDVSGEEHGLVLRGQYEGEPSTVTPDVGETVVWDGLPEGTFIWVDGAFAGAVSADGLFNFMATVAGAFVVRMAADFRMMPREWTIQCL